MSEEKKPAEAKPAGPKPSKLPMILLLVNFLAIAGAMYMLVYVKFLYKRPSITEETERARLAALAAKPQAPLEPGLVNFDAVTVNIAPSDGRPHFATISFALEIRDKTRQGDVETVRALIMDKFLGLVGRKQAHELNNVQGRFILRTELTDAANKAIFENAGRIKAAPAPQAAAEGGGEHGGGEHGGGEGHGEGGGHGGGEHSGGGAAHEEAKPPIRDLVTNVFFNQFMVQ
jgi:flagellar basal body-associated protein FliL